MHLAPNDTMALAELIEEAAAGVGMVLMKSANNVRNVGKTPAYALAEALVAGYAMAVSDGGPGTA